METAAWVCLGVLVTLTGVWYFCRDRERDVRDLCGDADPSP
jgi:hypothetical protein